MRDAIVTPSFVIMWKNYKCLKAKSDLQKYFGEDLLNATCTTPVVISVNDVINALTEYETGKVSLNTLVEWVNVIWFTDLFEYTEYEKMFKSKSRIYW